MEVVTKKYKFKDDPVGYRKQYYEAHKEKIAEYEKAYWKEHRERHNELHRKYYRQNPEKRKAASRAYYAAHREKCLETSRRWRERQPDMKERQQQYYRNRILKEIQRDYETRCKQQEDGIFYEN